MDEWILKYYSLGLYTVDDLKVFLQVQWITKEQYKETTGIDYATPLPLSDDHEPVQSEVTSDSPVEDTLASEATSEAPKNVTVSNIDSNSVTIGGE